MRRGRAYLLLLPLLWCCLGAAASPIPITVKNKSTNLLYFGQTYQDMAKPWSLSAWPEKTPPFFLLPSGVTSLSEVEFCGQPFLAKFYFDQPTPQGRLLAVRLVHWEKGMSRAAARAEAAFTTAIRLAFGEQVPKVEQKPEVKIVTYSWPGVLFNNQYDEGGQTWYVTLFEPGQISPLLAGLPIGRPRAALEQSLALEPYFEPDKAWPTIAGKIGFSLNLTCSPLKLRPLYMFAGYGKDAPLVGLSLYLSADGVNNWQNCGLEQLLQELQLAYGVARRTEARRYQWQGAEGKLNLYLCENGQWVLEYLWSKAPAAPPAALDEGAFPPKVRDVAGWGELKWNMSISRALEACPGLAKNSYARAGGRGNFVAGPIDFDGIAYNIRILFDSYGLEEVVLTHDGLASGEKNGYQAALQKLEQDYGVYDWQFEDANEKVLYWSRASGYLAFVNFKEPETSWRIVFRRRSNDVLLPGE